MPTPLHIYFVCSDDNAHLKGPAWFGALGGRLNEGDILLCTGKATPGPWGYLLLHVKDDATTHAVSLGGDDTRQFLELHGTAMGVETQWQPTRKEAMYLQAGDTLKTPELARELGRHVVAKAPTAAKKSRQAKAESPANGADGLSSFAGDMPR